MMRVKIRSSASTTKIAGLTSSLILAAGPFMSLKTGNGWYSTTKFLTFNRRDHLRQEEEGRGVKTGYSVKCFLSSVWVKLIVSLKFGFLFSWFIGQGGPKISCTTTQTLPNLRLPISSGSLPSSNRSAPLRVRVAQGFFILEEKRHCRRRRRCQSEAKRDLESCRVILGGSNVISFVSHTESVTQ